MTQTLLNAEAVGLHQSTATPPGSLLGYWTCTEPAKCQVWGRAVTADGREWLVALVNMGDRPHGITAKFTQFCLGGQCWAEGAAAAVRDLWVPNATAANATGSFSAEVPSHGTALLRMSLLAPVLERAPVLELEPPS